MMRYIMHNALVRAKSALKLLRSPSLILSLRTRSILLSAIIAATYVHSYARIFYNGGAVGLLPARSSFYHDYRGGINTVINPRLLAGPGAKKAGSSGVFHCRDNETECIMAHRPNGSIDVRKKINSPGSTARGFFQPPLNDPDSSRWCPTIYIYIYIYVVIITSQALKTIGQ